MYTNAVDREFAKNFLLSLGAHAALLFLCFLGGTLVTKVLDNNGDVEVIRASVRVDVVGMPKFTVQELKKMEAQPIVQPEPKVEAEGKKEETKPDTEDVIKKDDLVIQEEGKKKKTASFLSIVNDYSSKKVAAKPVEKGSESGKGPKNLDTLILEGNRLSKGSALYGDYTDAENSEFSAYVQNLPGVIRPYWKLPSFLLEKEIRCRIKIFIGTEGQTLSVAVQESSGNAEFDARALEAVKKATFPRPSESVGERLTRSGIILGFPL